MIWSRLKNGGCLHSVILKIGFGVRSGRKGYKDGRSTHSVVNEIHHTVEETPPEDEREVSFLKHAVGQEPVCRIQVESVAKLYEMTDSHTLCVED